jgi:hypothetical protein
MAVSAAIALGLDFSPGQVLAREIRHSLHRSIHPSDGSGGFLMVVSFGRASFRLEEDSVSLALEAATGGFCGQLRVCHI